MADTELTEVTGYVLLDWCSISEQGSSLAFTVTLRPSLADSSASYAECTLTFFIHGLKLQEHETDKSPPSVMTLKIGGDLLPLP